MRPLLLAFLLTACATQPPASPSLPPAIQDAIADHSAFGCAPGQAGRTRDGYMQTLDLNADGEIDYVFELRNFSCPDSPAPFCGSGGCLVEAYVSTPRGYVEALEGVLFDNPALIESATGATLLRDGPGGQIFAWNGERMAPR